MKEKFRDILKLVMSSRQLNANKVARLVESDSGMKYEQMRVRIYQYIHGKNTLSLDTLEKIFKALDVNIKISAYDKNLIYYPEN